MGKMNKGFGQPVRALLLVPLLALTACAGGSSIKQLNCKYFTGADPQPLIIDQATGDLYVYDSFLEKLRPDPDGGQTTLTNGKWKRRVVDDEKHFGLVQKTTTLDLKTMGLEWVREGEGISVQIGLKTYKEGDFLKREGKCKWVNPPTTEIASK